MTDSNEIAFGDKHLNPFATGLAGLLIGAGVGAATTKVLSDKKMRDKLMHAIFEAGEKVGDYFKTPRKKAS